MQRTPEYKLPTVATSPYDGLKSSTSSINIAIFHLEGTISLFPWAMDEVYVTAWMQLIMLYDTFPLRRYLAKFLRNTTNHVTSNNSTINSNDQPQSL